MSVRISHFLDQKINKYCANSDPDFTRTILHKIMLAQFQLSPFGHHKDNDVDITFFNVDPSILELIQCYCHDLKMYFLDDRMLAMQRLNCGGHHLHAFSGPKSEICVANRLNLIFVNQPGDHPEVIRQVKNEFSLIISVSPKTELPEMNVSDRHTFGHFFAATRREVLERLPCKTLTTHKNGLQEPASTQHTPTYLQDNWEKAVVAFNEEIFPEILYYGCHRFAKPAGQWVYLERCITKGHLVVNDTDEIVENLLMPHILAGGFSNVEELFQSIIREKSLLQRVKSFFSSETASTPKALATHKPTYFLPRISSPALSHWLVDALIPYLECRTIYPELIFLYGDKLTEYQKHHLDLFNIPKNKVQIYDWKKNHKFENCITQAPFHHENPVLAFASVFSKPQPAYMKFADNAFKAVDGIGERIYVSRKDAKNARILINEVEIEDVLIKAGFSVVNSSDFSEEDWVSVFRNASVIAGALGAGLLNAAFSKPGAKILALTGPSYYEAHVAQIASLCGHTLGYIIGDEITSYDAKEGGSRNSNFYICPNEILKALKKMEMMRTNND